MNQSTLRFTNPSNQFDGFGAQYQRIITTYICIANKFGINSFYYNPMTRIEHNYTNSDTFIDEIEDLMNLKKNIPLINKNNKYTEINMGIINEEFEKNIDKYCNSQAMNNIKYLFWKNKEKNIFKNDKINVAVHIRRLLPHDTRIAGTDIPDDYYLNVMKNIRNKYQNKKLQFHIYSVGNINNLKKYECDDVKFHIDENICSTFIGMVSADILVLSSSSFSYIAALLSEGEIYYKPYWQTTQKPRKEWIICN